MTEPRHTTITQPAAGASPGKPDAIGQRKQINPAIILLSIVLLAMLKAEPMLVVEEITVPKKEKAPAKGPEQAL